MEENKKESIYNDVSISMAVITARLTARMSTSAISRHPVPGPNRTPDISG
jgi:hypothetical protein